MNPENQNQITSQNPSTSSQNVASSGGINSTTKGKGKEISNFVESMKKSVNFV